MTIHVRLKLHSATLALNDLDVLLGVPCDRPISANKGEVHPSGGIWATTCWSLGSAREDCADANTQLDDIIAQLNDAVLGRIATSADISARRVVFGIWGLRSGVGEIRVDNRHLHWISRIDAELLVRVILAGTVS